MKKNRFRNSFFNDFNKKRCGTFFIFNLTEITRFAATSGWPVTRPELPN